MKNGVSDGPLPRHNSDGAKTDPFRVCILSSRDVKNSGDCVIFSTLHASVPNRLIDPNYNIPQVFA